MPPFLINTAIDELLKREFDGYRKAGEPHPMMVDAGIDAIPFTHDKLDVWRENFTGVQYTDPESNLLITGAVDDVWVKPDGELIVVDYKATSKDKEIKDLDPSPSWHDSYRKQMEVYQWLLRANGFRVSDTGYFVYANARVKEKEFAGVVNFEINVFPYVGKSDWIEPTLIEIKKCLDGDIPPVGDGPLGKGCESCAYARARTELTLMALQKRDKKPSA
jgi:CRISPR/Cas system-associated exonuclease Cas4 (RecB family)